MRQNVRTQQAIRMAAALLAILIFTGGSAQARGRSSTSELPDLAPDKPRYAEISPTWQPIAGALYLTPPGDPKQLRFTTVLANLGPNPAELLGAPTTDPLRLDANQCIAWVAAVCTERRYAGAMRWHDEHSHWHFDDFALYELRRLNASGEPDESPEGLIGQSSKASFCLQDTEPHHPGGPPYGVYNGCSGVVQGVSPGWADVYEFGLPGQSFPLDGLTDGRYAIVVTADPEDTLLESNEANNRAWAIVEITGGVTHAQVVEPVW